MEEKRVVIQVIMLSGNSDNILIFIKWLRKCTMIQLMCL
jgi:hypothetical protein